MKRGKGVDFVLDYAVWVGIGATLGLWRLARSAPKQSGIWVNVGLFVLMLALIGARLGYVFANRAYFALNPHETLMLWLGGLTWPGAVAGVLAALLYLAVIYRSKKTGRVTFGWIADRLYPLLPPVAITAWLGSWQAGVGYGQVAAAGAWYGVPTVDETGRILLRAPVQFLAALFLVVFFTLLERFIKPHRPAGRLSSIAFVGLVLHLLAASLFMADPEPIWNGLRLDTWSAITFLIGLVVLLLIRRLVIRAGKFFKRMVDRIPVMADS